MPVYPDTSFLVSLYMKDVHSPKATEFMAQAELPFVLTPFQELEFVNAVHQRVFRKLIRRKEAKASLALFRRDMADGVYSLKPFEPTFFERGFRLAEKHTARTGLRTLDLMHVAAALECKTKEFCSFDVRQRKFATSLGLTVFPS